MTLWIIESRNIYAKSRALSEWQPDFGFAPELKRKTAEAIAANCNDVSKGLEYRAVAYVRDREAEEALRRV